MTESIEVRIGIFLPPKGNIAEESSRIGFLRERTAPSAVSHQGVGPRDTDNFLGLLL